MGYFEYAITIIFIAVALNVSILVGAGLLGTESTSGISEITDYLPSGLRDINAIGEDANTLTTIQKFEPTGNVLTDTALALVAFFDIAVRYAIEILNLLWFLMFGYIVAFRVMGWPPQLVFLVGNMLAVLVLASALYIALLIFSSIRGGGVGT